MFSMTDANWRKQNKTVVSRLRVILRQGMFTDVTFIVQGQEFKCHKLILALGSPYFERLLYRTFERPSSSPISYSDVTPQAFHIVLNFLYTDKISFGNENQAFITYEAASKFEMEDLKSECEIYLSELEFRPNTVWNNLEQALALEMKKVQKKYLHYIQTNAFFCLKDQSFLKTSGDVVMQLMQSNQLTVSEIELLNKLVAWGRTKNPRYLKVIMDPYLRHVRFKSMTPLDFCSFLQNNRDLLSDEDSLGILRYLELPCKNNLPAWCSPLPPRFDPSSVGK